MKRVFYLLPVVVILLNACNNSTQKNDDRANQKKSEINKQVVESNHQDEEGSNNIMLDNGKKWKANPETISGISKMDALVQKGISGKLAPTTLYALLQFEFKTIFEKCTMTGESHNQLHNFLIPLNEHLEKFKEGNINIESLKELQDYLSTFKNYFE